MAPETVILPVLVTKRDLGQDRQTSIAQSEKDKGRKGEISRRFAITGNDSLEGQARNCHSADR